MKKILLSALMLTALSYASFGKVNLKFQKTLKPNTNCIAGETTCGTTYSQCRDGGYTIEEQLQINDLHSLQDCELSN